MSEVNPLIISEVILYILVIIIIVIVLIYYNQVLATCFFKHSYVKLLWEVFIFLFSILTLFYSFNADIFSNIISKDNFIVYPINQLRRNSVPDIQLINLNKYEDIDSLNFTFLVDRTLSNYDEHKSESIKSFIHQLKQGKDSSYIEKGDFEYILMSDFIIREFISSLSNKYRKFNSKIIIYNGIGNDTTKKDNVVVEDPKDFQTYLKLIRNKDNENTNTDISRIFQLITDNRETKMKSHDIVTIISDFEHEKATNDILTLESEIENYTENNTDSIDLNLVYIKGSPNNDISEIITTKELIKKYSHFINLYEFEGGRLTQITKKTRNLSDFITQKSIKDTKQKIIFYYPLTFAKFQTTNNAMIHFSEITKPDTFLINLKNELYNHELTPMKIISSQNMSKQLIDYPKSITIDSSMNFSLILESVNKSENLFLEISRPKDLVRQKIPILFQEYLPTSVCYVLIVMNLLVFALLVFFSLFLYSKSKHCYKIKNHEGLKIGSELMLIFPTLSVLLFLSYLIKFLITCYRIQTLNSFYLTIVIIIVFVSFFISLYSFEVKNFDIKCDELHKYESK